MQLAASGWRFEKSLAVNAEVVGDKYRYWLLFLTFLD
jgi:hypothetical protein